MTLKEANVKVEERPATFVRADLGEECDYRADDLFAAEAGVEREKIGGKEGDALSMIDTLLADGPKAVKVIEAEAERRELSWRRVEAAKRTAGVTSKKVGAWVWALPTDRLPL